MARDRYGEEIEEGGVDAAAPPAARTPAPRPPQWEVVPAGTTGRPCRSVKCGARIYDVRRMSTARKGPRAGMMVTVPVSCDVDGGKRPTATEDGKGISHFANCVDAKRF